MAVSWEERRYRCAWVALGPRVDDGDGCGDVFPHLHRQKSCRHQHLYLCSSILMSAPPISQQPFIRAPLNMAGVPLGTRVSAGSNWPLFG